MDWTDIVITTGQPQAAAAEAVAYAITGGGLYIEDYAELESDVRAIAHVDLIEPALLAQPRDVVKIHLYLAPEENPAAVLATLHDRLTAAGVAYTLHTGSVQQQDWENAWKQYYKPLDIGRRLAVVPSWQSYDTPRTTLLLDPGMAFGTGTHETTVLCLELLEAHIQGGARMLDIGTGSGILAIAALKLGAGAAEAVDIDPMCVRTAAENAQRNGVEKALQVRQGDLAQWATGRYQLITANIVAAAICRLAPGVAPLLAEGGVFIASGIIEEREEEVRAALTAAGLQVTAQRRQNGWVALCAQAAV